MKMLGFRLAFTLMVMDSSVGKYSIRELDVTLLEAPHIFCIAVSVNVSGG